MKDGQTSDRLNLSAPEHSPPANQRAPKACGRAKIRLRATTPATSSSSPVSRNFPSSPSPSFHSLHIPSPSTSLPCAPLPIRRPLPAYRNTSWRRFTARCWAWHHTQYDHHLGWHGPENNKSNDNPAFLALARAARPLLSPAPPNPHSECSHSILPSRHPGGARSSSVAHGWGQLHRPCGLQPCDAPAACASGAYGVPYAV